MSAITVEGVRPKKKTSPRKRAQRIRFVQYGVLALVVLLAVLFVDGRQVSSAFFRLDLIEKTLTQGLPLAFLNTLAMTGGAFVVGLVLGTVLALMRLSQVAPYRWLSMIYIEFFRGLPALIVLMGFSLVSLAFPGLRIPLDPYGTVWLGLGLVSSAYIAETIRAGIQAVPKGQVEAARSLGMPSGMATRRIVLPQAFRIVTPPLTNELVALTKDSSLVYVIGLTATSFDLTKYGRAMSNTYSNMTPLVIAGATYLLITLPLTFLVRRMEARGARAK
jgi:polar amino acid transport system permease protein